MEKTVQGEAIKHAMEKLKLGKKKPIRRTLDPMKVYLNSCATYHTFFVRESLKKVETGCGSMKEICNARNAKMSTRRN